MGKTGPIVQTGLIGAFLVAGIIFIIQGELVMGPAFVAVSMAFLSYQLSATKEEDATG